MKTEYQKIIEENKFLKTENEELRKKMEELEKRLAAYENAHTPYSRRMFKPKPKITNAKRGRPSGLPGTTRPIPKPDKTLEVKRSKCPTCRRKLKFNRKESIIIEDIPKPQPTIVTEFIVNHYNCEGCGEIISKHQDCPDSGRFGNNLMAETALMKFEERLTFRKIEDVMERRWNISITPSSVMGITRRVSSALEAEHEKMINIIRSSPAVYADETSMRINGRNHWIWIFVAKDAVLCVIRKSRGKKVVKEILGDYHGVLICDGLKSYSQFGFTIQRCWAHLLREAKDLDNQKPYGLFNQLFADAKSGLSRSVAEERLKNIISRRYKDPKTMKFLRKVRNGFRSWFTFLDNDVESTNNIAERALREHVVIRKIIGGLRSLDGARTHEVIMSCFATWKLHGLNLFDTLVGFLRGS